MFDMDLVSFMRAEHWCFGNTRIFCVHCSVSMCVDSSCMGFISQARASFCWRHDTPTRIVQKRPYTSKQRVVADLVVWLDDYWNAFWNMESHMHMIDALHKEIALYHLGETRGQILCIKHQVFDHSCYLWVWCRVLEVCRIQQQVSRVIWPWEILFWIWFCFLRSSLDA